MLKCTPVQRVCGEHFRRDGILLPLGHSREEFKVPNPTLFQTAEWPIKDDADPLDGWPLEEISNSGCGLATNDVYGKLYFFIRHLLILFNRRIKRSECHIHLFCMNAGYLPRELTDLKFDRIEVANISDRAYLGIRNTLACLGPCLQSLENNPHSTLITLFMNAVMESKGSLQAGDKRAYEKEMHQAMAYLDRPARPPTSPHDAFAMLLLESAVLFRDTDTAFDKYMAGEDFQQIEKDFNVVMKKAHTVIEKWPMRLKLRPGQKGAKEEFKALLSSGHTGIERYVEWRRAV
ncbi:hypothetical protein LTR37_000712 [Vermiconidia calcicola]|uniref:Uncharacterized protein n=1 Tax=Vermiconidia calcicola TaxID=1690605 RepID=A0ACC3P0U9_9PEZI|nr:hypothetical protein LTR37_000712 [Vermiconidia calcicola]